MIHERERFLQAGHLYAIEGPDGSGKTTVCKLVVAALRKRVDSIDDERENKPKLVETFRLPGGTPVGEIARDIVKNNFMEKESQILAFMLAFSEVWNTHVDASLRAGNVVILDRWYHSTLAYQLTREGDCPALEKLLLEYAYVRKPRITFILECDSMEQTKRLLTKNGQADVIEQKILKSSEYQEKIRSWYKQFAKHPNYAGMPGEAVVVIGTAGITPEDVSKLIVQQIYDKIDFDCGGDSDIAWGIDL